MIMKFLLCFVHARSRILEPNFAEHFAKPLYIVIFLPLVVNSQIYSIINIDNNKVKLPA